MSHHTIPNPAGNAANPRAPRGDAVHLGETSREKRAQAESKLARYPDLAPGELADLLRWHRREASAMDAALIASNNRIRERYRAFRRDHIDAFTIREKLIGTLLAVGALGFIGAVAMLGFEA